MHTKVVDLKEYSSKEVGLLIEVVLIEFLLIYSIINFFCNEFMIVIYTILSMIMFTMAYNNIKIFKKKYMTSVYIIVGLFIVITTLVEYLF